MTHDTTRPRTQSSRRRASPVLAIALLLGANLAGCGLITPGSEKLPAQTIRQPLGRQAQCQPHFPDANGWFGGDAAYSVPIPRGASSDSARTSLWLFGDTFVSRPENPQGRVYPFIHNSIGLSECSDEGEWALTTHWRKHGDDAPRAFFVPDPEAAWVTSALAEGAPAPYYWPFDGFMFRDVLFVGLLRVIHSEPRGPFNLPFRPAGMDLARIENPHESPDRWRIQLSTLSDDPETLPGSAFAVVREHLYSFTFLDRDDGRSPRILTRLPLKALRSWQPDLTQALETLDSSGRYLAGLRPDRALVLMEDDATEMSVHFDPNLGRWLAIYSTPVPASLRKAPGTIQARSAPSLEGPWSAPQALYEMPETGPDVNGRFDPNLFCYAAKAHPQFAPAGRLLITYVCNLFARDAAEITPVLRRLADTPSLYRATAVSLAVPETLRAAGAAGRGTGSRSPARDGAEGLRFGADFFFPVFLPSFGAERLATDSSGGSGSSGAAVR